MVSIEDLDVVQAQASYGVRMIGHRLVLFVVPHADFFEIGANRLVCEATMWSCGHAIINSTLPRSDVNLNNFEDIKASGLQEAALFVYDLFFLTEKLRVAAKADKQELFVFFVHCCPPVFEKKRKLWWRKNDSFVVMHQGDERPYDLDIGAGYVELCPGEYIPAQGVRPELENGASRLTVRPKNLHNIRSFFADHGVNVTVGREFPAFRTHNMVQVLSRNFPDVQVMQLEIVLGRFTPADFSQIMTDMITTII